MSDTSITSSSSSYRQYQLGILYASVSVGLFSIKPILIKLAYQAGGDATAIMSLRAASSLPFYLFILVWLCRRRQARIKVRQYAWQAMLVGILGYYFASALDIYALDFISAQLERLLIFLYPSFVIIFSWFFFRERPTPRMITSILIGYLGVILIIAHDFRETGQLVWVGSGLAVSSAVIFSIYLILSKKVITRLGSDLFTSIGMSSAAAAIMFQYSLQGMPFSSMSGELIWIGVATGLFCTVLPSYFMGAAMAKLTPSLLSLTGNIGPVVTTIFAILILDEQFTVFHLIGMSLAIWSVVRMKQKRNRP
ncbi:DMT family transporter [Vibrio salinus]|uniref:DMT family transporter n=1 Tax=Vibrio salinus TaxID=2899784 RepID=UPI001E4F379B|nr:DMT family transporter [Vibrio salinus]MCE0495562.1 DMT family transporter [Vibrio salinus]